MEKGSLRLRVCYEGTDYNRLEQAGEELSVGRDVSSGEDGGW